MNYNKDKKNMGLKIIFIFFLTLSFNTALFSQTKNEKSKEVYEEDLVTAFSKYFKSNKTEKASNEREIKDLSQINVVKITEEESMIDNIISVGKTLIGIPYRWGGVSEYGFDCSGFIKYIFEWFGFSLPRTSRDMARVGSYVSKEELKKGDLIFFSGRNSNSNTVGHIGIVVSVNGNQINIMHSSSSQGVHIEDLNQSSYFTRRYITARRLNLNERRTNIH